MHFEKFNSVLREGYSIVNDNKINFNYVVQSIEFIHTQLTL